MSTAYMSAPSYPFPPNQHQHQHKNLQQEWNELQVAQQRLTLQQQRLKLDQELLKTEKRNWKRSNKIKTSVQYDDQSINSLNSLIFDEKDEVVHELRQQLDETKEAAQKESLSLQEQLLDAQQTLENLKLEHGTSHAKRLDEVEKWKTMCAKEQEEMVQKQKEWQEQQQARDASFQSKLDNCRELIWQLELEKNNLELELVKVRDTPNDSDYWQGEAEKLRTQLVDTSQQLEDFRLLVPRNKQLLEQATVQQEKLRTKYTVLEAKYDEQQTLVTELQTFKEVWTQKYEALEQAHQKLVEEMKDCKNDQSESVSVASSSSLPNTTLPSDDPREWIRAGRKHVVEREWTSKTGLHGLYTGWLDITGNPQGHGTLRIDDGSIYDGEWNRGLRDGHGVFTSIDGDLYRGTWRKDLYHGRGVYVWPDGQMFTGDYLNGLRNGKGIETWPNGAKYEGDYQNDVRHGQGTHRYPDGRCVSGEYQEGRSPEDPSDSDFGAFINS